MPDCAATPLAAPMLEWLRAMPKAELHLHLDGSLRPSTALELARTRRLALPAGGPTDDLPRDLPEDLPGMRARLVAPRRCADQAELLRAFDLPVALLQDHEALERATVELVEDVAADGTRYAELRWAPSLHTRAGLSLRDGLAAVVAGAKSGARRTGTQIRLIAVALRTHDPETALAVAEAAAAFVGDGLGGFDLAGRERDSPDPTRFRAAFERARAAGLGITCHAGEWGGAAQVRRALEVGPWRIAHGAPAADDPRLMAELAGRGLTLDLCPTSNVQAGGVADLAAHPLPRLLRAGVPLTLSTDDRTVSDVTLVDEYALALAVLGLEVGELIRMARHAYRAAFLHHDEPLRAALVAGLEAWIADHPAPGAAEPDVTG